MPLAVNVFTVTHVLINTVTEISDSRSLMKGCSCISVGNGFDVYG